VTKTEVYRIIRDVCIVSNRLTYIDSKLSEMEILAQTLCETAFTPTTFRHTKRLLIRISNLSHKKFHFKNFRTFLTTNILLPGDQEGLFKLAVQLRKFFNSVIYNTATGFVLLVNLTNI
jgi:hypothetical protein